MEINLHITSGDCCGKILAESTVLGEVFVWHDVLYEGPRKNGGIPDEKTLLARAAYLEEMTDGGLDRGKVFDTLQKQYQKLVNAAQYEGIVLWFDACLFDMSMLVHILACLKAVRTKNIQLLVVDKFPGIDPFNGLGQLNHKQMASVYDQRIPVTDSQFSYAEKVDLAFAEQDMELFSELAKQKNAPIPWVPATVARWLEEQPDPDFGLGKLQRLALNAIRNGCDSPGQIFQAVAAADNKPQYWGDTTLWTKINALAERHPPLVKIEGPAEKLPQWDCSENIRDFRVYPVD